MFLKDFRAFFKVLLENLGELQENWIKLNRKATNDRNMVEQSGQRGKRSINLRNMVWSN